MVRVFKVHGYIHRKKERKRRGEVESRRKRACNRKGERGLPIAYRSVRASETETTSERASWRERLQERMKKGKKKMRFGRGKQQQPLLKRKKKYIESEKKY